MKNELQSNVFVTQQVVRWERNANSIFIIFMTKSSGMLSYTHLAYMDIDIADALRENGEASMPSSAQQSPMIMPLV